MTSLLKRFIIFFLKKDLKNTGFAQDLPEEKVISKIITRIARWCGVTVVHQNIPPAQGVMG